MAAACLKHGRPRFENMTACGLNTWTPTAAITWFLVRFGNLETHWFRKHGSPMFRKHCSHVLKTWPPCFQNMAVMFSKHGSPCFRNMRCTACSASAFCTFCTPRFENMPPRFENMRFRNMGAKHSKASSWTFEELHDWMGGGTNGGLGCRTGVLSTFFLGPFFGDNTGHSVVNVALVTG